jgi:hypothetical protein
MNETELKSLIKEVDFLKTQLDKVTKRVEEIQVEISDVAENGLQETVVDPIPEDIKAQMEEE